MLNTGSRLGIPMTGPRSGAVFADVPTGTVRNWLW